MLALGSRSLLKDPDVIVRTAHCSSLLVLQTCAILAPVTAPEAQDMSTCNYPPDISRLRQLAGYSSVSTSEYASESRF